MKPYPRNPRQITTKQFSDLEKWLDQLGDLSGIVHNLNTDEIIGGNQRARVFGLMQKEAAVIEMTRTLPEPDRQGTVGEGYIHWRDGRYGYRQVRWDAETSDLANLVANHAGGTWDWDILVSFDTDILAAARFDSDWLKDLNNDAANMALLLETAMQPEAPPEDAGAQTDRAAELLEIWQVQTGDVWEIPSKTATGVHRLVCGDCTDRAVVEQCMQGEKAGLVFTDPPYNVASEGSNYAADAPTQKKTYEALKNADWDKDFDIKTAFSAIEMAMGENCAVYVCTSHWLIQTVWEWMRQWSKFCSYNVWCKPNPAPCLAKRHWTWATELIAYAVRGKHTFNFPKEGHALNWWEIVSPSHTTDHPTEKPIAVPERAILHSSNRGDIVFDSFAGSGTTAVACERQSRLARLIEISPAYCAVVLQRLQDLGLQPVKVSPA